jgi:hypothetical protein
MALTADREVDHYVDQELRTYKVAATTVYKGALVGLKTDGYCRGLVAGDKFVGLAFEKMDNSTGSDGDKSVRVYTLGDFEHTLTGATIASLGRPVFASADNTLTFSANGNSYVGILIDVTATNTVIVRLDPARRLVKTVTHAVENLAANGDIAARAVHCFDSEAWIIAARVVNQATAATGVDDSNTSVHTLKIGAATVVTETFDSTTAFPAANTEADLGAVANNHAATGDVLTYEVTNGTTADLGPFLVEVDYV